MNVWGDRKEKNRFDHRSSVFQILNAITTHNFANYANLMGMHTASLTVMFEGSDTFQSSTCSRDSMIPLDTRASPPEKEMGEH